MSDQAVFCLHGPVNWQLMPHGSLANKRLAVKDLFAIKGFKNGAGNPDWLRQAKPAEHTSDAVNKLMHQGCELVGLTQTDEMAYSLEGNNQHYGAAENPRLPGHACGGSSMGSAAAVAANSADIGLGTDTGGSIRVPASYCGLFGIRPSHGVIEPAGLLPLAPAFDTTGWFCQQADLLSQVGDVLLPAQVQTIVDELVIFDALFELVEPSLARLLRAELERVKPHFKKVRSLEIDDQQLISQLADAFRVLQGREIGRTHGDWVTTAKPHFAPPIAQRFAMAMALTEAEEQRAKQVQAKWCALLAANLSPHSALFLPTTPTTAPQLGADTTDLRMQILTLTAIAGLAGAAQVHLPLINVPLEKQVAPYGFSLLMTAGNDRTLLQLVKTLTASLTQQDEN
ncbi:amidase [Alteromonas sp. ASW11-36]|uniref:Amidase n=1 Tax=Alteromonas arenosi TaxID=3055817 RepID=A0ABT7SYS7_9ALTE|nr:amidase [Alteromonas sp. ASW11-36]MDM7861335.1 amidase [Alteromonas sp. ASW11-36]